MSEELESVLRSIARVSARERYAISVREGAESEGGHDADKVRALVDAVRALEALRAPYALIGGVAVGLHTGVARATLDTDLAVHTTSRNSALIDGLVRAGFQLRGEFEHSVNFRHGSGEPVQLAFDVSFDPMLVRGEYFEVEGVRVRVVTKVDLIEMKRRAAADPSRRRSKALRDEADVAMLLGDVGDIDEGW